MVVNIPLDTKLILEYDNVKLHGLMRRWRRRLMSLPFQDFVLWEIQSRSQLAV